MAWYPEKGLAHFMEKGWIVFPFDPVLRGWTRSVISSAREAVSNPENVKWFRYQNTWFVGVNVLKNDSKGAVPGGPVLGGRAVEFITNTLGVADIQWDRAQISVCYPGYPKPSELETEAAFKYRLNYDAAHIDGILPEGQPKRRYLRTHHRFIFGIPLVDIDPKGAPLVVWEGSHEIIRAMFSERLRDISPDQWQNVDITDIYHAARNRIFDCCHRVEIVAQPGQAYLVHRLALHGTAPWNRAADSGPEGRMICYFRPDKSSFADWLGFY